MDCSRAKGYSNVQIASAALGSSERIFEGVGGSSGRIGG